MRGLCPAALLLSAAVSTALLLSAAAVSAAAHRDCANNTVVRVLTYLLFCCRQAAVWFMSFGKAGRLLAWPLRVAASMLQRPLNKVCTLLVCCPMQHSLKSDCAAFLALPSTCVGRARWRTPAAAHLVAVLVATPHHNTALSLNRSPQLSRRLCVSCVHRAALHCRPVLTCCAAPHCRPALSPCTAVLQVLLISVEVAMEYLMGLTSSPHVEQLQVRPTASSWEAASTTCVCR